MPGLLDRARKRQHFPVQTTDGSKMWVRPMKESEVDRMTELKDGLSRWFMFGICLAEEDQEPVFTKEEKETDEDFAKRVKAKLDELDFDMLILSSVDKAIAEVIDANYDDLKKSSSLTQTQGSPTVSDSQSAAAATGGT